jgi:enoyl-CoA hydratase
MPGTILVERQPPAAASITISNPEKFNAMSTAMWRELDEALADLADDPELRVLWLRGSGGRAFASGADISEFPDLRNSAAVARDYDALAGRALARRRTFPTPVVALIEGLCIGGGLLIALACDLRYAAADATFSIPAGRVGLGYDWPATKDLVDAIGGPAAKEMLYLARSYTGVEAQTMGLINWASPADTLGEVVADALRRIQANAPLTIRAAKGIVTELLEPGAEVDLAHCNALSDRCSDSADYAEGYAAFLEKRKPRFHGR